MNSVADFLTKTRTTQKRNLGSLGTKDVLPFAPPPEPASRAVTSFIPLTQVQALEELHAYPMAYERVAFMEHIRRYDREALRQHYLKQPVLGAEVWANYAVNLWEYEHGVEELTSYPWNVTIPMTDVCNARCTFCIAPHVRNPEYLKVEEVKYFAEALRYAIHVNLQGLGEPLAHPQFEAIAEELKKYMNPVARFEMITNAWLLSGRRWELLKNLNINIIHISANAATEKTHQIAMGARPGMFQTVLQNIENVMADPGWPRNLKVSMVVTRHSLPEVTQFLELFTSKGVKTFQLNALLPIQTPEWEGAEGLPTLNYLDLWCGHLSNAAEWVEKAQESIAEYRKRGCTIYATPEQWLISVDQRPQTKLIQLKAERQKAQQAIAAQTNSGAAEPLQTAGIQGTALSGERRQQDKTTEESSQPSQEKSGRIYCPMVYTSLNSFQHTIDAHICCYMANAPGHRRVSLRDKTLREALNHPAFKMVRNSLNSADHIPICESCPYGSHRV